MAMTAQLWTLSGLATELGIDRRAVGKMLAGIAPDGKGSRKANAWLMKTAVAALTGRGVDDGASLEAEKTRHAKEAADRLEMENAARRGALLERADVDAAVTAAFARVRAKLLAVPSKAAPQIVQGLDTAEIEHLLRSMMSKTLQELSETDVASLEDNNS